MREIKFRAWKNGFPWMMQVLSLEMEPEKSGRDGVALLLDHPCPNTAIIKKRFHKEKVKDLILMQFTGLKDKNGVEIFEGDLIRQTHLYRMDSCAGGFECVLLKELKDGGSFEDSHFTVAVLSQDYCEVIGNVYENPELVKA